jgi:hypothetical protein
VLRVAVLEVVGSDGDVFDFAVGSVVVDVVLVLSELSSYRPISIVRGEGEEGDEPGEQRHTRRTT